MLRGRVWCTWVQANESVLKVIDLNNISYERQTKELEIKSLGSRYYNRTELMNDLDV